jgi:hypothetical protein
MATVDRFDAFEIDRLDRCTNSIRNPKNCPLREKKAELMKAQYSTDKKPEK